MTAKNIFLEKNGWDKADKRTVAGDASGRKYERLTQNGQTVILMDASQSKESIAPFIQIDQHLESLNISVPHIIAKDEENGFLLLEDFGNNTFKKLLDERKDPEPLYKKAMDVLIDLHKMPIEKAIPKDLRYYSPQKMYEDMVIYLDWITPDASEKAKSDFKKAWEKVLPMAHACPQNLVLRDYHVANVMLLPKRDGVKQCGVLDFQDAYRGPTTYDIVSLLEDARREVPQEIQENMKEYYLKQFPGLDKKTFETSYAIMAGLRHTRVLGIFKRLHDFLGKKSYQKQYARHVGGLLRSALQHPVMKDIKLCFDVHDLWPKTEKEISVSQAMILAAGKGSRMRPLTDGTPKPLLKFKGRSIMGYTVEKLADAGVKKIVINGHYLKKQIKDFVDRKQKQYPEIKFIFSDESGILETGGGVRQTLPYFGKDPFFVVNGDSYWEGDENVFETLSQVWREKKATTLMLCDLDQVNCAVKKGDYFLKENGNITRFDSEKNKMYMGVHITNADLFSGKELPVHFSLLKLWDDAEKTNTLFGQVFTGQWYHLSTPEDLIEKENIDSANSVLHRKSLTE
ncbi:MAG: phosphotransferase [Alphaproteobacteria bacterium]|nr:phosphotransferase [Alphaproteobacteria bacterium]